MAIFDNNHPLYGKTREAQLDTLINWKENQLTPDVLFSFRSNMSEKDINKRYKLLSLLFHPDKNPELTDKAQKAFVLLNNAKDYLVARQNGTLWFLPQNVFVQGMSIKGLFNELLYALKRTLTTPFDFNLLLIDFGSLILLPIITSLVIPALTTISAVSLIVLIYKTVEALFTIEESQKQKEFGRFFEATKVAKTTGSLFALTVGLSLLAVCLETVAALSILCNLASSFINLRDGIPSAPLTKSVNPC
jgi:hypothetical protein